MPIDIEENDNVISYLQELMDLGKESVSPEQAMLAELRAQVRELPKAEELYKTISFHLRFVEQATARIYDHLTGEIGPSLEALNALEDKYEISRSTKYRDQVDAAHQLVIVNNAARYVLDELHAAVGKAHQTLRLGFADARKIRSL